MNIFFDTSTLFKLYHHEAETNEILDIFSKHKFSTIYLSEI
jgi:hypothetical protein